MATPLTSAEFDELISTGVLEEVFFVGYERAMSQGMSVKALFGPGNFNGKRSQDVLSLGNLGYFDERKEGGSTKVDSIEQLFKTTFTAVEYSKTVPIDRNLVADQQYLQISDLVDALGDLAGKTQRKHAASVFNNAFSSSYLGGDSKALCATDHPLDLNGAVSQGNYGTTAFSYDAVMATIILMMAYKNSRNLPIAVVPDTIVIPVALIEQGLQITQNVNEPDTADRNINAILAKGGMKLVVDPYLDVSDTNNWFLVDSVLAQRQLKWVEREALNMGVDMPTQTDANYYAGARMRYDYGWSDWRWVYGHAVS